MLVHLKGVQMETKRVTSNKLAGGYMFYAINHSRIKFYLANAVSLGLYGAAYMVFQAGDIGKKVGSNLPGTGMGILLTVLTLGLYPGVMLSVLAYKLTPASYSSLGHIVLVLNLASLMAAIISGGLFIIVSVALWSHAAWLVVEAVNAGEEKVQTAIEAKVEAGVSSI